MTTTRSEILKGRNGKPIDRSFTILKHVSISCTAPRQNIQACTGTGRIQIESPGADNPQRVRKYCRESQGWNSGKSLSTAIHSLTRLWGGSKSMLLREQMQKSTPTDVAKTQADVKLTRRNQALKNNLTKLPPTQQQMSGFIGKAGMSPLFALSNQAFHFFTMLKTLRRSIVSSSVQMFRAYIRATIWFVLGCKKPNRKSLRVWRTFVLICKPRSQWKAVMTGEVINDARLDYDHFARPAVSMTMSAAGSKTWGKVTAAASTKTPQGRIAIVLDNYVYTAPTVQGEIPNGNSQITGSFELEEAERSCARVESSSFLHDTHR